MFAKLPCLLTVAVSLSAQADPITITTRSSGMMYATFSAATELGVPPGPFPYELVLRSEASGDPTQGQVGTASMTLTANGQTRTFHDQNDYGVSGAQFGLTLPLQQEEYFHHSIFFQAFPQGFAFDANHSVYWPAGSRPGIANFAGKNVDFTPATRADVVINLLLGGERAGQLLANPGSFQLTIINPIPEPGEYAMLAAGLAALAIAGRLPRAAPNRSRHRWPAWSASATG